MPVHSTPQSRQDLDEPKHTPVGTSRVVDGGAGPSQAARLAGGSHGDAGGTVEHSLEGVKESTQAAAEDVGRAGQDFLKEQKAKAANQISCFSDAIHSAAEHLRQKGNDATARYAEMAATRLEGVARYLGDQDLRSLMREVEQVARRRPELFLGGMFLTGLGISRFLKASRSADRA